MEKMWNPWVSSLFDFLIKRNISRSLSPQRQPRLNSSNSVPILRPPPAHIKPPILKPPPPMKRPPPDKIANFARATLKKIKSERRGPATSRGKLTLAEIAMGQIAGMKANNPYGIDKQMKQENKEEQAKRNQPIETGNVKRKVVINGKVVTARIAKNDTQHERAAKKPSKLKEKIIEERKTENTEEPTEYVDQVLTGDLDTAVETLLQRLKLLYNRVKNHATKKITSKRFKIGFRECQRAVKQGKAKCLIVVPDLENAVIPTVIEIIEKAKENQIPIVFALNQKKLGKTLKNGAVKLSI